MPSFSRKALRQEVGVVRMRECLLGTTALVVASGANPVQVFDPHFANTDYSGQQLYQRAWLRVASADYRVGSFNYGSGGWVSGQLVQQPIASGADFEVHDRLSATELDHCIDEVLKGIRMQQEVTINASDGLRYYNIDAAASPHFISDIQQVYFFADPANSTNRDRRDLSQFDIVNTGSGRELRLPTGLQGTSNSSSGVAQQIVLDALLELTLGADDAATVTLNHSDWLTWGAAAQAYHLIIQRAPGQETTLLEKRRAEAARMFTKLSARRQPARQQRYTFDAPLSGEGRMNPNIFTDVLLPPA